MQGLGILRAGECMLALRSQGELFAPGFAGDVVIAMYLKRLLPGSTAHLLSAVGNDSVSHRKRRFPDGEGLDTLLLFTSRDKTIELYLVDTDEHDERSYSYWRSDSAARIKLLLADPGKRAALASEVKYFYFSGITLAVQQNEAGFQHYSIEQDNTGDGLASVARSIGTTKMFSSKHCQRGLQT